MPYSGKILAPSADGHDHPSDANEAGSQSREDCDDGRFDWEHALSIGMAVGACKLRDRRGVRQVRETKETKETNQGNQGSLKVIFP